MPIWFALLIIAYAILWFATEALYIRKDRAVLRSDSGWKIYTTFDGRTIVNIKALIRSPEFQQRIRKGLC
jgi:hypothetical protein